MSIWDSEIGISGSKGTGPWAIGSSIFLSENKNARNTRLFPLLIDLRSLDGKTDGTFTRASGQWIENYLGGLEYVENNEPGFKGGRLSGSTWLNTDHNGNRILERSDYPNDHETSHAYIVGDKAYLSRFGLTCIEAGDSAGTAPTVSDTDVGNTIPDSDVTWSVDGYATLLGVQLEEASTNKCTNYNAEPDVSLTNVSTTGGTLSRFDDTTALSNAGLEDVCPQYAFKLVNTTGSTQTITIDGTVANTNKHSIQLYGGASGGNATLQLTGSVGAQTFTGAGYSLVQSENLTPGNTTDKLQISVPDGVTVWWVLNQLEEKAFCTSIIKTDGTTATRDDTLLSYPVAENLPVNDFSFEMEVTPLSSGQDGVYYFGSRTDSENYFGLKLVGGVIELRKNVGGVYHAADYIHTPTKGVTFKIKIIVSSTRGLEISIDAGTPAVYSPDTRDCALGTIFEIGSNNNTARSDCNIENVKIYRYVKPYSWLEEHNP